jgi:hypothetical protein
MSVTVYMTASVVVMPEYEKAEPNLYHLLNKCPFVKGSACQILYALFVAATELSRTDYIILRPGLTANKEITAFLIAIFLNTSH